MPDADVTLEYLCEQIWIVGDPDEVAAKLRQLYEDVGGFGTLLVIAHEWEPRGRWLRSLPLLRHEVMPQLADLAHHPSSNASGPALHAPAAREVAP